MDRLDLGILKMLLVNNGVPPPGNPALKKSFRAIAKQLGVDQGTIRTRMKRFQEQRILKGWYLGVNPGLAGQDVIYSWFAIENESDKDDIIRRLLSLPELERTCNYLGPKLKMVLLCNKGADIGKTIDRLRLLAGSQAIMRHHAFLEVPALHPVETDLAIIGNLRLDPWKSYSTLAKELGMSARTVKRRVERLSENGGIYTLPIIDMKALQGIIPVDLTVDYVSKEARSITNERITAYVEDKLMFSGSIGPTGYFSLMVPNVSFIEPMVKWLKRQSGVREAQADVLQDVVLNPSHFEKGFTDGDLAAVLQEAVNDVREVSSEPRSGHLDK